MRGALLLLLICSCSQPISYRDPDGKLGVWHEAVASNGSLYLKTNSLGMRVPLHFVDTGTPRSRVAKDCDREEIELFNGVWFKNVPCVTGDADPVVGNDLLGLFSFWFALDDDRARYALNLAPADAPASVPITTQLLAGENGDWPIVTIMVEGRQILAALDTGSVTTVVRTALFEELARDGRAQSAASFQSWLGVYTGRVTRSVSVGVIGAERGEVLISEGLDKLLDSGTQWTGLPVDAILGTDYLRWFIVNVDTPAKRVRLFNDAERAARIAHHPLDHMLR